MVSGAELSLGRGDGTFEPSYPFVTNLATVSPTSFGGSGAKAYDCNRDGRDDIIMAIGGEASGGKVVAILADANPRPKFDNSIVRVDNMRMNG